MAVAVLVVDTMHSSSGSLLVMRHMGGDGRWSSTPMFRRSARRHNVWRRLPAREPELPRLSLHVLVVKLGALRCAADAGADLNEDLLEVRALDRRDELQREAGLSVGLVLGLVGHQPRGVARHRARADRIRTRRKRRRVLEIATGR